MTLNAKPQAAEIAKLAAEIAILNARRVAVKILNTVADDSTKTKRTFTYKKAGQL